MVPGRQSTIFLGASQAWQAPRPDGIRNARGVKVRRHGGGLALSGGRSRNGRLRLPRGGIWAVVHSRQCPEAGHLNLAMEGPGHSNPALSRGGTFQPSARQHMSRGGTLSGWIGRYVWIVKLTFRLLIGHPATAAGRAKCSTRCRRLAVSWLAVFGLTDG